MMENEYIEITDKTLDDCITAACRKFSVTSDNLEYEVVDAGSLGFMGFNARNAVIRAKVKENEHGSSAVGGDVLGNVHEEKTQEEYEADRRNSSRRYEEKSRSYEKKDFTRSSSYSSSKAPRSAKPSSPVKSEEPKTVFTEEQIESFKEKAENFLQAMFGAMGMEVTISYSFDPEENILNVCFDGDDMGVLIGKRGQTLDSIQYLVSLVVNKNVDGYVHVKADTEDYRARRKKTLENLAKNIAFKVKRSHRAQALEPMNPYERRVIHSALQSDRYVTTYSEGEDPYRRVVIAPKR